MLDELMTTFAIKNIKKAKIQRFTAEQIQCQVELKVTNLNVTSLDISHVACERAEIFLIFIRCMRENCSNSTKKLIFFHA